MERQITVHCGGEKKLESYDRVQPGFATAGSKSFEVSVGDGWLDVELVHRTAEPRLLAVEVEKLE